VEVGEPHLYERPHGVFEAGLPRGGERLLVALTHLLRGDALLEPVVAGHEQPLDLRASLVTGRHGPNGNARYHARSMVSVFAVLQVIFGAALVTLILMHSGRDAGFGGIGFTPTSQGGTHIVERNLTRLTVAVGVLFGVNTVVLYRLLA
jgi:preprotein translocase subunit SecG